MAVVLVVEDDEQVRVLAESILKEAGHETRCAATMTEAQALIAADEKIDVLFVDLSLLDYQEAGLEVAKAAAKHFPVSRSFTRPVAASLTGCLPCLSNGMCFSPSHIARTNSSPPSPTF